MRNLLVGASIAALALSSPVSAQGTSVAADAAAFGAREAVQAPDLSPDGSSVLYLTPGQGPRTVAVISNLVTGKSGVSLSADGQPEKLGWCKFVSAERMICRFTGVIEQQLSFGRELVGIARETDPHRLVRRPFG